MVTPTSRYDSHIERANIRFNENKLDGVDMKPNSLEYCIRNNGGKICDFRQTDI